MITDVPTSEDFERAGIDYLNLSWDAAINLLLEFDKEDIESWDEDGSIPDQYWEAAQRKLATGLMLTFQGLELLLKSRIVAVSPYLLLVDPAEWPGGCASQEMAFADFKTIEAHQLQKVHDTVASARLSDRTKTLVDSLRRRRNRLVHGIDRRIKLTAEETLTTVLELSGELLGSRAWIRHRREYCERLPTALAYCEASDFMLMNLAIEFDAVVKFLKPADCKRLLGLNKKQRRYFCPECKNSDVGFEHLPRMAVLTSGGPKCTSLYCLICGSTTIVDRGSCPDKTCKGSVFDDWFCLTCGKGSELP